MANFQNLIQYSMRARFHLVLHSVAQSLREYPTAPHADQRLPPFAWLFLFHPLPGWVAMLKRSTPMVGADDSHPYGHDADIALATDSSYQRVRLPPYHLPAGKVSNDTAR